jgi:hypothetical protein
MKGKTGGKLRQEFYTIEEVARKVGLSQKRIRDYERAGFINPMRHQRTNNRIFTDFDIDQIRRVNVLVRKKGFTLKSLQQLFRYAPCWEIFECRERANCVAYRNPHDPCWRLTRDCICKKPCETCVVYLVRSIKKERLLSRKAPEVSSGTQR